MKHIKGLDTLRAFAVFFVIIQHLGVWFDSTSPSGKFITAVVIPDGGFGVDLFFVLSGFLITSILLKAKEESAAGSSRFITIRNFFARRALRIFPIYYLLLFTLYLLKYPDIRQYFWYFATYTGNVLSYRTNSWNAFSHTWTLSVEEQFYLLWPWLIVLVNTRYIRYVLIGSIAAGIISTYTSMVVFGHMAPLLVINSFDSFGIGGYYAWVMYNTVQTKRMERIIKTSVLPALCVYFYWKVSVLNGFHAYGIFMGKTINSIISLWLIILVVNNRSVRVGKYLLGNPFLNYIGKISYGIYLYHVPYIMFVFNPFNKFLSKATMSFPALNKAVLDSHFNYWFHIAIIVLIAGISYRFIEKPILRLKKYFDYNDRLTNKPMVHDK